MDASKLPCAVEAILFVAGEPVNVGDLAHALAVDAGAVVRYFYYDLVAFVGGL